MKFLVDAQLPRRFANTELEKIPHVNLNVIEAAFASRRFVEVTCEALVVHE